MMFYNLVYYPELLEDLSGVSFNICKRRCDKIISYKCLHDNIHDTTVSKYINGNKCGCKFGIKYLKLSLINYPEIINELIDTIDILASPNDRIRIKCNADHETSMESKNYLIGSSCWQCYVTNVKLLKYGSFLTIPEFMDCTFHNISDLIFKMTVDKKFYVICYDCKQRWLISTNTLSLGFNCPRCNKK